MRGEVRRDVSQACNPITQHTAHSTQQQAYTARTCTCTCTCTYLLASQVRDHDLERLLQKTEDIHTEQVLNGCGASGAVLVGEKCELQHGIVFVFPLCVGLRGEGLGSLCARGLLCTVLHGVKGMFATRYRTHDPVLWTSTTACFTHAAAPIPLFKTHLP